MKKVISLVLLLLFVVSCSTVPITGRKRVNFVSDAEILPASFAQYESFLAENKISGDVVMTNEIQSVGMRISKAVDQFMRSNNMVSEANSYRWEFNLIDDPTVNAWCMPGGKVVFYTGILPICDNTNGIAAVMGHEVAHALANHGQQRMSAGMIQQGLGAGVAIATKDKSDSEQDVWMQAFAVGSSVGGMLPFSRSHETEADEIGLYLTAIAGYNPDEASLLWERMKANSDGKSSPEFLSTHPSNDSRISNLKVLAAKAKEEARKFGVISFR